MKLYMKPGACSFASHVVLREAGLPFDLVKVDLATKKMEDGGDFLAVNPKGQVPTLGLDEGGIITDRTKAFYAVYVDMEELRSEGDEMVGDAIAESGIEYLKAVNFGQKVGNYVAAE